MIYFCDGTDKERIEWFEVINTAGEKLTPQELPERRLHWTMALGRETQIQ